MCTHIIGYTGQRNYIKRRNETSGGNKDAMFQRIREWLSLKNYQYQVTTGIYMLEPWERTIFSILCYVNFFIPVWVTPMSWITYASNIYISHTIAARTCCYMCSNAYSWRKFRFFGHLWPIFQARSLEVSFLSWFGRDHVTWAILVAFFFKVRHTHIL